MRIRLTALTALTALAALELCAAHAGGDERLSCFLSVTL